nr:integrase, catalytic region, zinc finger, CCHC-type, peptidase aspartic, catalytic [Tanacetum cinerariifolium]
KKTQKIDRIARSLLIQGLPNDIYSLIDINETAKDLWDALERQMCGSEYGEQHKKAAILYEHETFKATKREQLLDTYLRYLQVINDLKKCGYKKDNCDVNDASGYKKKVVVVTSDPLALVAEKTKVSKQKKKVKVQTETEESDDKAISDLKKITALLAKAFNRKKYYAKPTNNNLRTSSASSSANKKPENDLPLGEILTVVEKTKVSKRKEKVKVQIESEESDDEDISDLKKITALLAKSFIQKKYYVKPTNNSLRTSSASSSANKKPETFCQRMQEAKVKDYNYYKKKMLPAKKDSDEQVILAEDQAWMESSSDSDQEINANMVFMAKIEKVLSDLDESSSYAKETIAEINEQEILFDKMSHQLVEMNNNVLRIQEKILEKETKNLELEGCVSNKDLEIEKCLERLNECENKLHKIRQTNQTIHMIMPSKDNLYNGRKGIGFENPSYFGKAKDLRPSLYNERVIGLGYTLMFLTHSNEALEIEKFKRSRENKIKFAYNYGNLNASYVNEKINFSDDYFQEIINLDFKKIDSLFQQTSSLKPYVPTMILEKIIIDLEDEVVRMFKLSVSQSVSPISVTKTSCASNSVESNLKRKRRKRTSSKQHDEQVNKDVLRADKDFVHFSDLDTLSSVRIPKPSGVMWMKKGSSNTVKADLSYVNHSNLNKNVKRYSCKDLMLCNISHHRDTRSAHACNNARNAYCNSYDVDVNDLFVFDDICLWIIDSGCSKHMTGNRALLTNFVEKFLGTVLFGNNDFAVIAGYEDVVIGSMTIKKVYYVKGLGHNLFSVGQFCHKGLEIAFRKSTCFVPTEGGVDLLTGDRSSNLYTIALNEVASNSSTCLLAKASSSQSWLWHQRLSHLNFATINNLVKNNLVQGLPKMKFEKDHLCSACEQGKIHRKHHKSKTAFASNKPLYLLPMDLCGHY